MFFPEHFHKHRLPVHKAEASTHEWLCLYGDKQHPFLTLNVELISTKGTPTWLQTYLAQAKCMKLVDLPVIALLSFSRLLVCDQPKGCLEASSAPLWSCFVLTDRAQSHRSYCRTYFILPDEV
jgi:hypothetical protein